MLLTLDKCCLFVPTAPLGCKDSLLLSFITNYGPNWKLIRVPACWHTIICKLLNLPGSEVLLKWSWGWEYMLANRGGGKEASYSSYWGGKTERKRQHYFWDTWNIGCNTQLALILSLWLCQLLSLCTFGLCLMMHKCSLGYWWPRVEGTSVWICMDWSSDIKDFHSKSSAVSDFESWCRKLSEGWKHARYRGVSLFF